MKAPLKTISRYAMAFLYISAGINHFINPGFYETIMPAWIPFHVLCILLSGMCEILLGILLFPVKTHRAAAWLIISMLIVFFAVHIQLLADYWSAGGVMLFVAVIRIPVQFVLIWWAYSFIKNPHQRTDEG